MSDEVPRLVVEVMGGEIVSIKCDAPCKVLVIDHDMTPLRVPPVVQEPPIEPVAVARAFASSQAR
jgi:hypothetical protein